MRDREKVRELTGAASHFENRRVVRDLVVQQPREASGSRLLDAVRAGCRGRRSSGTGSSRRSA